MNTKKFLVGGIVGGVVYFLLGWVVYGMLLKDFMHDNMGTAQGVMKAEDQFVWWAMIVGHMAIGFLLSYVLARTNTNSFGGGLATGGIIGLLMCLGYDAIMYGVSNLMTTTGMMGDIGASTVMAAITGAVIGIVNGMMSNSKAA